MDSATAVPQASQDEPVENGSTLWACGEPYKFPIPKSEGDPWNALLIPLMEKDQKRCEAWKDEIEHLLIFAGLFSAVVTAFIIETYKKLQADPGDAIILLLSRIAANQATPLYDALSLDTSIPSFSPSPSIIRINILFIIGLILSLTTVLIGIISLQWLRNHRTYDIGSLNNRHTFALITMRIEALERWHVPNIIAALPLLLQTALVLFFVGIIDFLRNINIAVVIPVAGFIGLTLSFLLLTTLLPTLQGFLLNHPSLKINNNIPAQCPYISPQSKTVRRLATRSKSIFFVLSSTFAALYWVFMYLYILSRQMAGILRSAHRLTQTLKAALPNVSAFNFASQISTVSIYNKLNGWIPKHLTFTDSESWSGFDYMAPGIFDSWRTKFSYEFDTTWLIIRDNYFQSLCPEDSWLYQIRFDHEGYGGLYDSMLGIWNISLEQKVPVVNADFEVPIFTAYHCVVDFTSIDRLHGGDTIKSARTRNQYFRRVLELIFDQDTSSLTPFLQMPNDLTVALLAEEQAFTYLRLAHRTISKSNLSSVHVSQHLAEVTFRLLGHLFSRPRHMQSDLPHVVFDAESLYRIEIFESKGQSFTTQWALTLHAYFQVWEKSSIREIDMKHSFHAHPFVQDYIWNFWKVVAIELTEKTIPSSTIEQIRSTFQLINRILESQLESNHCHGPTLECLCYAASMYGQNCRKFLPGHAALEPDITRLLPTFVRCREYIRSTGTQSQDFFGGGEYSKDQEMISFSDEWWDILISSSRPQTTGPNLAIKRSVEQNFHKGHGVITITSVAEDKQ